MDNNHLVEKIPGKIRKMMARWVICGELVLETAAHFGGENEADAVDMGILRDAKDGLPLLPGASLTGALRGHLADVLGGYCSAEDQTVASLFGDARLQGKRAAAASSSFSGSKDEGSQSPLIVFDSLGTLPKDMSVEIRDGVAIDAKTGTALPHKKFDFEVLPAGTRFPLRMELIIEDHATENKWLNLLHLALDGLATGDISLGMRRSRGLGAIKACNWKAIRYDLTAKEGWLCWITSSHDNPLSREVKTHPSPWPAIHSAFPALEKEKLSDRRQRVLIDLDLDICGDLLIRSSANEPTAPDAVHLHSAGKPVLPGTSLAGALRSQALRIARLVRSTANDGEKWVNQLFGPFSTHGENLSPYASKLKIAESFINAGKERVQTRIAIDRFTGGVVQSALFDERVNVGGKLKVQIELRNPTDSEQGLLLLLIKDLLSGEIPVGGASSIGRGVVKGTAEIMVSAGKRYKIGPDLALEEEGERLFNQLISAFHQEKPLTHEEVL